MQCPSLIFIADVSQTIEGQVNAFANADPGEPSQQDSVGIQAICTAQFLLESSIIFRRQGSGEIFRTGRKVFAEDKAGSEGMTLECQVVEQPAQTEQELLARMVAKGRTQRAKPSEPAQHMGIAAELCESADLGKGGVKIANEPPGNTSIFGHGVRLQGQRGSGLAFRKSVRDFVWAYSWHSRRDQTRAVRNCSGIFAPDVLGCKFDIKHGGVNLRMSHEVLESG